MSKLADAVLAGRGGDVGPTAVLGDIESELAEQQAEPEDDGEADSAAEPEKSEDETSEDKKD